MQHQHTGGSLHWEPVRCWSGVTGATVELSDASLMTLAWTARLFPGSRCWHRSEAADDTFGQAVSFTFGTRIIIQCRNSQRI